MKEIIANIIEIGTILIAKEEFEIKKGKRGGHYYINDKGEKVYVTEDGKPKDSKKEEKKVTKEQQKDIDNAIKSGDPEKAMKTVVDMLPAEKAKDLEKISEEVKEFNKELKEQEKEQEQDQEKEDLTRKSIDKMDRESLEDYIEENNISAPSISKMSEEELKDIIKEDVKKGRLEKKQKDEQEKEKKAEKLEGDEAQEKEREERNTEDIKQKKQEFTDKISDILGNLASPDILIMLMGLR